MSHRNTLNFVIILAAILLTIAGCGRSGSPISPVPGSTDNPLKERGQSTAGSNDQCWGFYTIEIDPDSMEANVMPLRSAEFTANVTKFMQPPISPINLILVKLDSVKSNIPENLIALDLTLRHPFPGYTLYRGFDVRGIFMANGSQATGNEPTATYANWGAAAELQPTTEPVLLNADGYTRWWNPTEFTSYGKIFGYTKGSFGPPDFVAGATVNPYKYFADELTKEAPFVLNPVNRGTFSTNPGLNTREYLIQFNAKPYLFNYAIDASWYSPDPSGAPDYPVDSFPLSANAQEAYKVDLRDAGSTAYWVSPSTYGGDFTVDLEVFDWQAQGAMANPSVILDEINGAWLESPAFFMVAGPTTILPGSTDTSAILRLTLAPNFTPVSGIDHAGKYPVWIGIESADPDTYKPQVPSGDSFAFPPAPLPLTAFFASWITVSGNSPNQPPIVESVVPSIGRPGVLLKDVKILGQNFQDGATVEFIHEGGTSTIGPLATTFIDPTTLLTDLDLTGAELGFYDVTVTNPDLLSGTLNKGFEVTEVIPTLVLDPEVAFPPYMANNPDGYTPAIAQEYDGDITFCFEEYVPDGNQSTGSARSSSDDGLTWPKVESGIWSWGGPFRHWDTLKIIAAPIGNVYHTTQLYDPVAEQWATGFLVEAFTQSYPWPQGCHVTQDVSHFTEIMMDKDHYFYAVGDQGGMIQFKRSMMPENIQDGNNIWSGFTKYTISSNGYLSRARSFELYNDVMNLAFFEPDGNVIRLAFSDSDWQTWDTSTVIWNGDSSGTSGARDPGLQVDETGYHVTFVRHNDTTNQDELCYTHSDDRTTWSAPVVVCASANAISDTPVERYFWNDGGTNVIGTVWWDGTLICASFSLDMGATWSDPVLISELSPDNKQCDFIVASTGSWHFVWTGLNIDTGKTGIHYRRGHMEMK